MPGAARGGGTRRAGAALLALCLTLTNAALPQADRQTVQVGQVTAIAGAKDLSLAIALAERADQPMPFLDLGVRSVAPLTLLLVRGDEDFRRTSRGRIPAWGAGAALPAARLVVIRVDKDDPARVLRHELAHLALHQAISGRVPLWFDEGYAVLAAGEVGRMEELRLNLAVVAGKLPSLDELDGGLRSGPLAAQASYALAGTAVSFLASRVPAGSLRPLLDRLALGEPFDSAVARATGFSSDRFEEAWRAHVKRDHGILLWLSAGGMWLVVSILVVAAWQLRRRRDAPRRAALDEGWDVSESDEEPADPARPT